MSLNLQDLPIKQATHASDVPFLLLQLPSDQVAVATQRSADVPREQHLGYKHAKGLGNPQIVLLDLVTFLRKLFCLTFSPLIRSWASALSLCSKSIRSF